MTEHFIEEVDIVEFKCFKNFHSAGFKQVNLISGKNNMGKTAFLEALLIHLHSKNVATLSTAIFSIKYRRENINLLGKSMNRSRYLSFLEAIPRYSVNSSQHQTSFEVISTEGRKEYKFEIDKKAHLIDSNEFSFEIEHIENINFIDNFGFSNGEIITSYGAVQKNDKEAYLDEIINKFDSRIESFKVIDNKPQCKLKDKYIEITEFGDGIKHLISIVCALFASQNGQLFIDEIDNGIHYTKLKEIWSIIFEVSKEVNCQVFATSHSKEMIQAFANTANEFEYNNIAYLEFGRKDDDLKSLVYDYTSLIDELSQNHEIRGW